MNDILAPMAKRESLRIDMSRRLINQLKSLAYGQDMTLRELVMESIAKNYPKLKGLIDEELK